MQLLMSDYTAADAEAVEASLAAAVDAALDTAAERIGAERRPTVATRDRDAIRVEDGVAELRDSTVEIVRHANLVELQVRVPWRAEDRERRSLAAAAFTSGLSDAVARTAA